VLTYILFGAAWILSSDALVGELLPASDAAQAQTIKGLVFVALTALMIYGFVAVSIRREQAARQQFQRIFDNAPMGIALLDLEGHPLVANPQLTRFLGITEKDLRDTSFTEFTHPDDATRDWAQYQQLIRGEIDHYSMEKRYVRPGGQVVWGSLGVTAIRDGRGRPTQVIGMVEDIDELKRNQARLRVASEAVENALNGYDVIDENGHFAYANRAYLEMWGYDSLEEVVGTSPVDHCVDPDMPRHIISTLDAQGEGYFEFEARRKDGSTFIAFMAARKTIDGEGNTLYHGSSIDITERHRQERELKERDEQLRQSQKMDAIGQLAGGVAHDFNNQLQVISLYSELLAESLGQEHPGFGDLTEIQNAADRSSRLTQQLLAFGRRQPLAPKLLDLNEVVRSMDQLLSRLLGENIQLSTELAPSPSLVLCDPGQMDQVIMNLAINARDAMPEGGTLHIRTEHVDVQPEQGELRGELEAGPHVVLSVRDTGKGMDEETRARIFEPFFTTKTAGTGLGLSTVFGVIKQSGGHITCHPSAQGGSCFQIYLPRSNGAHTEPQQQIAPRAQSRGERILVAEDEEAVRASITMILEREGYEVLAAPDGPAALELARKHEGKIDLLLTDCMMPGMHGKELADILVAERPAMGVLFMSGYTDGGITQSEALGPETPLLQKPFRPEQLRQRLQEALEKASESR
jgi:two-component system cell cycle sensor histidine kinase/response regulator CckA